jgi:hypothetical protein
MLAFVPNVDKANADIQKFAVHFYIDAERWPDENKHPITGLSVPLHGFSATVIQHITRNYDIRILSSPNQDMHSILKRDICKYREYYNLERDVDKLTVDQLMEDFEIINEEQVTCHSVCKPYTFVAGIDISIQSARLAKRFKTLYDKQFQSREYKLKNAFCWLTGNAPASINNMDEQKLLNKMFQTLQETRESYQEIGSHLSTDTLQNGFTYCMSEITDIDKLCKKKFGNPSTKPIQTQLDELKRKTEAEAKTRTEVLQSLVRSSGSQVTEAVAVVHPSVPSRCSPQSR